MILDSNTDRIGWGSSRLDSCESNLIDLMAQHDFIDRFCLDDPGKVT